MFRCDAGSKVGMGHWTRCRALASWFESEDVLFVVGVDEADPNIEFNRSVRRIPLGMSEPEEWSWWREQGIDADALILDLSHAARLGRRNAARDLFCEVGGDRVRRIAIDGIGAQTLVDESWPIDAVVLPYAGACKNRLLPRTLAGPAYFILPREWGVAPGWPAVRPVRRLIVTMGGADPRGLTICALDAAAAVACSDWSIRVVIGPAFAAGLVNAINERVARDERIGSVKAPPSLAPELGTADMAIASTGLTKYELAWAGVPSVQISIDRVHAGLNAAFEAERTAIHLGVAEEIDAAATATALTRLASDAAARSDMSRRGQALVDGRGGARVAQVIRELIDAQT